MFKNRHTGVTMIELIVVIAIVGIMAALAIPSFTMYFEKARVRGAADGVSGLLAQARSAAVKNNRQAIATKIGADDTWCVGATLAADPRNLGDPMPVAVACDCSDNVPVCSIGTVRSDAAPGVTADAMAFSIRFDQKTGGSVGFAAARTDLTSTSGEYVLSVRAGATGQARVCRMPGTGVILGYPECEP